MLQNDTRERISISSHDPPNKDKQIIEKGMTEMRKKLNDLKQDMQQLDLQHQNKMKDLEEKKNSNDIKYNLLNESNIRKIVETKLEELYNMSPMKELDIYRSRLNKQHEHVMSVLGSLEGKYDTVKSKVNCVKCNHTKYFDLFLLMILLLPMSEVPISMGGEEGDRKFFVVWRGGGGTNQLIKILNLLHLHFQLPLLIIVEDTSHLKCFYSFIFLIKPSFSFKFY